MKVMYFVSDTMEDLCGKIEEYSKENNLEIVQISAYCDSEKVLDQRAIVTFREEKYEN